MLCIVAAITIALSYKQTSTNMKNLLVFLLLLLGSNAILCQQLNVTGTVYNNNSPLEFANVLLLHAKDSSLYKGGLSEEQGKFKFTNVAQGDYFIEASMIGFGKAKSEIFTVATKSINIEALNLVDGIELEEIVVTSKKPFIELKADKMVVNVSNSSVNAGNSALEVLEKSPGVVVDNNDNISLRGKQGVQITINGKNQHMSGDDIARMLQNMPASNIQSIEIITNPSAKYDAEGNSGIINIVLKKNENLGYNGRYSSTFRYSNKASHFHDMSLNYRSDKVNIYGGGEYYNWGGKANMDLIRIIPFNEGETTFDQKSLQDEDGDGYDFKIGMDYSASRQTTISLLGKAGVDRELDDMDVSTKIFGDNMPGFDNLEVLTRGDERSNYQGINAGINHKINDQGFEINFDTDYRKYHRDELINYDNFFRDLENNDVVDPYLLRNDQDTDIEILASTLDLSIPIKENLNIETGIKYSSVNTINETIFEEQDLASSSWNTLLDRSNDFIYDENVTAVYVNGSGNLGKLMIQAGLRMEQTESLGDSPTLNQIVSRSYTDFFPSVSVSRMLGEQNNISLTYSRRIERPNYQSLNPFTFYLDQYTFSKGNPFLNPQYSNAYGLNFALGRKLFVAINYSRTHDAITSVIEQFSEENTTFQTNENLESFNNASLTISMPKVWSEWWTSRLNYTGFYNEFNSPIPSGVLNTSALSHVLNLNNEIQLPMNWAMEMNGRFQSKIQYGLFEIEPRGSLDLGFSKRILNNKGNIKISLNDIFYTNISKIKINQDDINLDVIERDDTRRISVTFGYSFGNQKVKRAKRRTTAAEEANQRI